MHLTLTLVEALVKNCGTRLHRAGTYECMYMQCCVYVCTTLLTNLSLSLTHTHKRLYRAVNDLAFMTEMKKVARRFVNKSGQANVLVAELVLDIVQAWGESFLTRRRQFPNMVRVRVCVSCVCECLSLCTNTHTLTPNPLSLFHAHTQLLLLLLY